MLRIINIRNKILIAEKVKIASSLVRRIRGLILTTEPSEDEGLLLTPCISIHMIFMFYPIDAVFISATNKVVALYKSLRPWIGFSGLHFNALSVLELKSGSINRTEIMIGDILNLEYYKETQVEATTGA